MRGGHGGQHNHCSCRPNVLSASVSRVNLFALVQRRHVDLQRVASAACL
ncbi:putative leader peptide [Nocardia sp. BMG51109]